MCLPARSEGLLWRCVKDKGPVLTKAETITVNASELRRDFATLFNQVVHGGKIVVVEKYKDRVVMVPAGFIEELLLQVEQGPSE